MFCNFSWWQHWSLQCSSKSAAALNGNTLALVLWTPFVAKKGDPLTANRLRTRLRVFNWHTVFSINLFVFIQARRDTVFCNKNWILFQYAMHICILLAITLLLARNIYLWGLLCSQFEHTVLLTTFKWLILIMEMQHLLKERAKCLSA